MIFLGWMTSSLIVPRISDIYGRKKLFLAFQVLQVLSILALMNSDHIASALLCLFSIGFAGVGRSPIVYIYMQELLTPEYQKIAGSLFGVSCAVSLAFGTAFLQLVSKDALMIFYVSVGLSVFAVFVTSLFIPESPKYLFATGQYERCREVLGYISRVNGQDASKFKSVRFSQEDN